MTRHRLLPSFIILFTAWTVHGQVDRVEPPHWWTGMNHSGLQLMVHGKDIAGSAVEVNYQGVQISSVSSLESPDYLFITLGLDENARPGNFTVQLNRRNNQRVSFSYELKERTPGSAGREGFNNSDVICLVMPDRFANGDTENDVVEGMRETVVDRNDRTGRHGGDLEGIRDHLDYLSEMGFTALWLNPVLENDMENSSYHGYSITDFYRVDPRLGSNESFRTLTQEAREKGIKMVMDLVFNHIGLNHPWMEDPPSSGWINYYPEYVRTNHRRTVNQDPYASKADRERMVNGWFVPSMPDLNQRDPFLAEYLIQHSIWWIEHAGLAGIRMDTYPYPDKEMMAEWNRRVLLEYPLFNIVGEEWSLDPGLVSYWQKGKINKDGYRGFLPGLMDFPLQSALIQSLLQEEGWDSGWLKLYETLAADYQYPDPFNLVVFPDNHDMSRFYMQLGMDRDLYRLGIIYILTTRGIPQILYGSEILLSHMGSEHHGDIRKDFPGGWPGDPVNGFTGGGLSGDERETQDYFRKLLHWRRENPVIHSGRLIHFAPEGSVYVFGRYNQEKKVMVILNKSPQPVILETGRFRELTGTALTGRDVLSGRSYDLTESIEIPGVTGLILEME